MMAIERKNQQRRHRRLTLESLETRTLLAGNIDVSISGGNLIVRGDEKSNQLVILQLGERDYAVVGIDGTNVEGNNGPFIARGVSGNIEVDLKRGHDLIGIGNAPTQLIAIAREQFFGEPLGAALEPHEEALLELLDEFDAPTRLSVARNLIVRTGAGRNVVSIVADIGRNLTASLGSDNNVLAVVDSSAGGTLTVRGGSKEEEVFLRGVQVEKSLDVNVQGGGSQFILLESVIGSDVLFASGSKHDSVIIRSLIEGNLAARTGSGLDGVFIQVLAEDGSAIRGNVDLDLGRSHDFVGLAGVFSGNINVRTHKGKDHVELFDVEVQGNVNVDTGDGDDRFVTGVAAVSGSVFVSTGWGADEIGLRALDVGRSLSLLLGSSDDVVQIHGDRPDGALVLGGPGFDSLFFFDQDVPPSWEIRNLEIVSPILDP